MKDLVNLKMCVKVCFYLLSICVQISFIFIKQSHHFWFMADNKVIFNWLVLSSQIYLIIKSPNYHLSLANFKINMKF